jgi:hypothetical protein
MSSVLGFIAEIPALREIAKQEVVSRVNDPLLGCRPGEILGYEVQMKRLYIPNRHIFSTLSQSVSTSKISPHLK